MPELLDWNAVRQPPRVVQIGGKHYTIPPVGIRTGAMLRGVYNDEPGALAKFANTEDWYRGLLGTAYEEMLADDVEEAAVDRAALTALTDFNYGRNAGDVMWLTGGTPEAQAVLLAAIHRIAESPAGEDGETPRVSPNTGFTPTPV